MNTSVIEKSAKIPSVTIPRSYTVSFDATIPDVHPAAMPDQRKRIALYRQTIAWDALDAANQVKMEVEREHLEDSKKPNWKAINGVTPHWDSLQNADVDARRAGARNQIDG